MTNRKRMVDTLRLDVHSTDLVKSHRRHSWQSHARGRTRGYAGLGNIGEPDRCDSDVDETEGSFIGS